MSQTMKAWFAVPGAEGAVFELREAPAPTAGPGQVVVAVRAAGTNRGELIRGAALRPSSAPANPARAGTEFAGEISALGDGVSGWKPGDPVMGRAVRSEEHTSELQSPYDLVCRLLLEKKKTRKTLYAMPTRSPGRESQ